MLTCLDVSYYVWAVVFIMFEANIYRDTTYLSPTRHSSCHESSVEPLDIPSMKVEGL